MVKRAGSLALSGALILAVLAVVFIPNPLTWSLNWEIKQTMGTLAADRGRYSQAETLLLGGLRLAQRYQKENPSKDRLVLSLNALGHNYWKQGMNAQAEESFLLALEREKSGGSDALLAKTLNNLGVLYLDIGRLEEAEPLLKRSFDLNERLLGWDDPYFTPSLNNLATLYSSLGKYSNSEMLYQEAIQRSRHGEDIALFETNLASLYVDLKRYGEAEPLLFKALEARENLPPGNRHDLAATLYQLARLYHAQGKLTAAAPFYQRALEIYDSDSMSPSHPREIPVLEGYASLLRATDPSRLPEAIKMEERAKVLKEQRGP